MGKRLKITPENVRGGADRISTEKTTVIGIAVPDASAAIAGLMGFSTCATLADAHDAVVSSLKMIGSRYERMAELCRTTADAFELASMTMPGILPKTWMSQQIGYGLTGMGDLNPGPPSP